MSDVISPIAAARLPRNKAVLNGVAHQEIYEPPGQPAKQRPGMVVEWFDDAVRSALIEPESPLIEDLLDEGALSVFYGDSNAGKTFVALDAMFAVATGQHWNGRRVKQGLTIYVAAEGGKKIRRRLAALAKQYDETCGDTAPKPLFALIRYPIDLRSSEADLNELIAKIRGAEKAVGQTCVWVIVDTLSRAMAGGDENSPVDMGRIVNAADHIRAETKAHFSYVHHTGKDTARGARGHSLLRAATDTEIEVAPSLVTVTKQRDMESGQKLGFSLVDIPIEEKDGKVIKSAVVQWRVAADEVPVASKSKSVPATMRLLLDAVGEAISECGDRIRPYQDGPQMQAIRDQQVRIRYYSRIAEAAKDNDDPKTLAERQRKNFNNAIKGALDRKLIAAAELNGERWIWLL